MKICAYVPEKIAKRSLKNDNFNKRMFTGLMVIVDSLERSGHPVEFSGIATIDQFDIVLVTITSDIDWWQFIDERTRWPKGNYKVIVGGPGVLNVNPFLEYADYFVLGRGESVIIDIIENINDYRGESVIRSDDFSIDDRYLIKQEKMYPHEIELANGKPFCEHDLGCNHKCLFCGYTWQRKRISNGRFGYDYGAMAGDKEIALLDFKDGRKIDFKHLRTTALDGLSERLRTMVNKPITREIIREFFENLGLREKKQQVKIYNILGYPTETIDDWIEFVDDLKLVDKTFKKSEYQSSILLHSTPFRAMPATPMACQPMSYVNYRKRISKVIGAKCKGNIFYQGNQFWAVEGMGGDALCSVILSAAVWRGEQSDADSIRKIAKSKKFWRANSLVKQRTLENCLDVKKLFGVYKYDELPTRYLKTYCDIDKAINITNERIRKEMIACGKKNN